MKLTGHIKRQGSLSRIDFPARMLMECPLCHTQHPLLINGNVPTMEDMMVHKPVEDRGYAFCSCRNIFYTDWSNIDQRIYDEAYFDKYDNEKYCDSYRRGFERYYPFIIS